MGRASMLPGRLNKKKKIFFPNFVNKEKKKRTMSITDLCGSLKSFSDLKKHAIKVRFTESTEVKAGGWFRLTLSRHSDASGPYFLDCRKVFLRFKMRITESGSAKCWIDGPTASVVIDRHNNLWVDGYFGRTELCASRDPPGKHS